jgi:hypothetical protein
MRVSAPRDMELEAVYAQLSASLQADDYRLIVGHDNDRFVFTIEAGPTACADCLVSEEMFVDIAAQVGRDAGLDIDPDCVAVVYTRATLGPTAVARRSEPAGE